MSKLTVEENEELRDLVLNHDGAKAFLKELENHVEALEKDIISYTLTNFDTDNNQLFYLKAKADGARKLFNIFSGRLETVRKTKDKDE